MGERIIILDFATAEVHIFNYDSNVYEDGEHFLKEQHSEHGRTFRKEDCQWMVVDLDKSEGRMPLYIH